MQIMIALSFHFFHVLNVMFKVHCHIRILGKVYLFSLQLIARGTHIETTTMTTMYANLNSFFISSVFKTAVCHNGDNFRVKGCVFRGSNNQGCF